MLRKVENGWLVSGVVTIQSGLPFSILDSSTGTLFVSATLFTTGDLAPGANFQDAVRSGRGSAADRAGKLISGSNDPVGQQLEGVRTLIERYCKAVRNISYDFYQGGRHEMLNELNRGQVRTKLLVWLSAILGGHLITVSRYDCKSHGDFEGVENAICKA